MFEIQGKYNKLKVLQDKENIEDSCIEQLKLLLEQKFIEGEDIRIMPDCHTGAGCVIGTTMTLKNRRVCPNLVGVDINCGMLTIELPSDLKKKDIDFKILDDKIQELVPVGHNVQKKYTADTKELVQTLLCAREFAFTERKILNAIGSLGGGNHFIEMDENENGRLYSVIHTGSRNLGLQVARYYQDLADKYCNYNYSEFSAKKTALIADYKAQGRRKEIQPVLAKLIAEYKHSYNRVPRDLAYLEGEQFDAYIHDMKICAEFAHRNRYKISELFLEALNAAIGYKTSRQITADDVNRWETLHNYIDTENMILRKGAISAKKGERVLIPMNMRDGSLICEGLGNADYNNSAPHGAGRLFSRTISKETISLDDFRTSMQGIYSTCIDEARLDESPFAYKSVDTILPHLVPTVKVVERLKPLYNFKGF